MKLQVFGFDRTEQMMSDVNFLKQNIVCLKEMFDNF